MPTHIEKSESYYQDVQFTCARLQQLLVSQYMNTPCQEYCERLSCAFHITMLPIVLRNTWAQKTASLIWNQHWAQLPVLGRVQIKCQFSYSSFPQLLTEYQFLHLQFLSVGDAWSSYMKRKGIGNATIFRNIEWFVIHTTSLYLGQVEPKDECWDCSSLQPPLVELNSWTQSQKNFQLPWKNSTPKTPDAPFRVGGYLHESTHHAFLFLNALEWYLL